MKTMSRTQQTSTQQTSKQQTGKPTQKQLRKPQGGAPGFVCAEVPLYYQLGTILREQIHSGAFAVGDKLPTEAELVSVYGVSRITVRQALKPLENDGLIRREAGRGTFVCGTASLPEPLRMEGSLDDLMSIGKATAVHHLDEKRVAADRCDASAFVLDVGSPVVQFVRLRLHEDTPFCYIVSRVPCEIAECLTEEDRRQGSMLRAIERRLETPLKVVDQTVTATLADASVARLLETPIGAPLLLVDRVARTQDGRAVARLRTRYRADVYSLHVHLTRTEVT